MGRLSRAVVVAVVAVTVVSCAGAGRLLLKSSPHETYRRMLEQSGLATTALGQDWARASAAALAAAAPVALPFHETGYFAPAEAAAVGYRVELARGRRLSVEVTFESGDGPARLFADLFHVEASAEPKRVASLEPEQSTLTYEAERNGAFILRLQPELLRGGRFTVTQRSLASLPFPVPGATAQSVQSLFGAERDAGRRAHEGVDIFAPRGTAVVAVAAGVARPSTNNLGGNVVWLEGGFGSSTYYYAHLDRWASESAVRVAAGDVVGYIGNTGNARTTAPHLHFGIYERGALDPWPFIQPDDARPQLPARTDHLGQTVRTTGAQTDVRLSPVTSAPRTVRLTRHSIARVVGATGTWLRVALPDRTFGYVAANAVTSATPLRTERLQTAVVLRDRPDPLGTVVEDVDAGASIEVLGGFADYELVRHDSGVTGWRPRS